jgi:WD40 repeat protein
VRTWQLPPRPAHLRLPERGPPLPERDGVGVGYDRSGLRAVAVSPDGNWLATGGWDKTVEVWHAETGLPAGTLAGHTGVVTALAFSKDSMRLLSGTTDRTARLWDVRTGKQVGRAFEHGAAVHGVAVSPDGTHILTGAGDGTCKLWKLTGETVKEWKLHTPLWAVAFNPDGQSCAAALWQGVTFCNLAAPDQVRGTKTGNHHVTALAFSPDGKRFIAGGMDNSAHVRETASGKPVAPALHHRERAFPIDEPDPAAPLRWMQTGLWNRSRLLSVAFHPEGRIVATGDQGRTARLWDADSGIAIGPPLEHPGGVHGMTFTPDGKYLLTVSTDRVVRRWPVPVPVKGDATLLKLRTEVITGLELADGAIRRLDGEAHRARRRRLEELAPPRFRP